LCHPDAALTLLRGLGPPSPGQRREMAAAFEERLGLALSHAELGAVTPAAGLS
jgi:hypothetical protein